MEPSDLARLISGHDGLINCAGNVADGERFVNLVDRVVASVEHAPGWPSSLSAGSWPAPHCWTSMLRVAAAWSCRKLKSTYWPHRANFERLERSSLDWRLLCPGPMVDQPPLGPERLRISLDRLPVEVPAFVRALPGPLVLPLFASLVPQMIVPYADAARSCFPTSIEVTRWRGTASDSRSPRACEAESRNGLRDPRLNKRRVTRMDHTKRSRPHRVAIVGGGFGGLTAAKRLRRADVDVTLIDRTNHHLFQPLLYQLATGILSEGDIAPPLREVLRDQRNASVVLGEVVAIDLDTRRLTVEMLDRRSEIDYDSLIVATGASQSYFGHPEFAHDAPGMKTIDDALELRGRILGAFEMAEREPDPVSRRRFLTFVVVGAGPTGVELAGQLAELSRHTLRRNFRRIDPAEARIVLLDAAPTILGSFPESLRRRAMQDLLDLGVEVYLGTTVTHVDERGIATNATDTSLRRIEAATKIWAAGVRPRRSAASSPPRPAPTSIGPAG